ncbi:MAG: hypothetical protein AVDCRST_MAG16-2640, partial [uncultured Frankineae bacterium]
CRSTRAWCWSCCARRARATRRARPTASCRSRSTPTSTPVCSRSSASPRRTSSRWSAVAAVVAVGSPVAWAGCSADA